MKEIKGDLWDLYERYVVKSLAKAIVIPTNGTIKKNGECVLGAGLARDAKARWNNLPDRLAKSIQRYGNVPISFDDLRIITFPVKHNWWEIADVGLIELSARALRDMVDNKIMFSCVFVPQVGCGNGKLRWREQVKPVLEKYLDTDQFVIVRK